MRGECTEGVLVLVANVPLERFQGFGVLVHPERESGLVRSPSKSFGFLTLFSATVKSKRCTPNSSGRILPQN
jgi:hypothetical protein